jgi:hypothetical protein
LIYFGCAGLSFREVNILNTERLLDVYRSFCECLVNPQDTQADDGWKPILQDDQVVPNMKGFFVCSRRDNIDVKIQRLPGLCVEYLKSHITNPKKVFFDSSQKAKHAEKN